MLCRSAQDTVEPPDIQQAIDYKGISTLPVRKPQACYAGRKPTPPILCGFVPLLLAAKRTLHYNDGVIIL